VCFPKRLRLRPLLRVMEARLVFVTS
jgi:hypothetical protein